MARTTTRSTEADEAPKPKKPTAPPKIPATVGAAIDLLYRTRERRKLLEAEAGAIKSDESAIEDAIFAKFAKQDLEGARGKLANASVSSSDVPTLEDWDAFAKYLRKHPDDLDLLQRRLSLEAVRARWADKKTVPGVGLFTKIRLHLTKLK